jgi:hypothetical protein
MAAVGAGLESNCKLKIESLGTRLRTLTTP